MFTFGSKPQESSHAQLRRTDEGTVISHLASIQLVAAWSGIAGCVSDRCLLPT